MFARQRHQKGLFYEEMEILLQYYLNENLTLNQFSNYSFYFLGFQCQKKSFGVDGGFNLVLIDTLINPF